MGFRSMPDAYEHPSSREILTKQMINHEMQLSETRISEATKMKKERPRRMLGGHGARDHES